MTPFDSFPNRRNVMKAALLPFAAVRGSAANSAVTVGLIGTGNRGTHVASALQKNTSARVVALCDVVDAKIERAKQAIGTEDAKVYNDFKKLLESDVDAVIIATPVYLHPEHFEAAVKARKHIYVEKPAGVDVAGCKRVMRWADSADRKLNITFGFQRRYAPAYLKAKQVVDAGTIGAIRMGHAHFIKSEGGGQNVQKQPRPQTEFEKGQNWHSWRDLSGDLIVENNVHSIDVLNWFMGGRPKSAIGSGTTALPKRGDNRDCNFVSYEYDNGRQGQLSGTTVAPRNFRHVTEQFFGELGMVETSENFWRHFQSGKHDVTEKAERSTTIDSVSEFVKRVSEGKPENVGARGAESTLTAILGRMAMDARREVTWEEMMKEG